MSDQIIRRFKIAGELEDDSRFQEVQTEMNIVIECQMRDEGYVPVYDLDPVWRTWLIIEKNIYGFSYAMQGVYVGEDKSWDIKGVVNNRFVEKSKPTSQNK